MLGDEEPNLPRLIQRGQGREEVRVLVLTSTRAAPGATIDRFAGVAREVGAALGYP